MPRIQQVESTTDIGGAGSYHTVALQIFDGMPNVTTIAANAPAALAALVAMRGLFLTIGTSLLGAKLSEQIAIAVAQSNGCSYCLSAHTVIGKMHGLDASELAAAKQASSANARTAAILALAVDINRERGRVTDTALAAARMAGVTDAEVMEIVGHVALNVFTNYLKNVNEPTMTHSVIGNSACNHASHTGFSRDTISAA